MSDSNMATTKKYHQLYIGLVAEDRERLARKAKAKNQTTTELAREAIRWYLDFDDGSRNRQQDNATALAIASATSQIVKALNSAVDRICKMLARQGRAIGTLYELSWMSLPDDENARKAFEAAANRAKQRMARHIENDERELAENMKKVVNG